MGTASIFARQLEVIPSASGWRSKLGLAIGSDIQAYSAALAEIASSWEQDVDTPTLTNTTNLDASTAVPVMYERIGDQVSMDGLYQADATAAAGTTTVMGMSLPIASTFTQIYDLVGVGVSVSGGVQTVVRFLADTSNHRATATWLSQSTANLTFTFRLKYRVLS